MMDTRPLAAAKGDPVDRSHAPNFLFLIADDHRHDALAHRGDPTVETPQLDRLAAEGASFTHAYNMGSYTGAVCIASRAMLHTGRSLFRAPALPAPETPLLGELLWRAGYTTFGTGKWHNQAASYARSFGQGGRIFFGGMANQYRVPTYDFQPSRVYDAHALRLEEGRFSTDIFTEEALAFLNSARAQQGPFFAYVALTSPHDPRTAPAPWATRYAAEDIELPPNFAPEHAFDIGVRTVRDEVLAPYPRDPAEIRQHIADYYGMISHQDAAIGRLLAALEETGLRENTVVVYTADHGLGLGQHGLMGKQNVYEHSLRVPLILRGPGIPATYQTDALLYLYDLFPTLLERAGVALPSTNEGYSLNALLTGVTEAHRSAIFSAYHDQYRQLSDGLYFQRAIRGARYKLIEYQAGPRQHTQLFDLREDPHEQHNLADQRGYLQVLTSLRAQLRAARQQSGDPLLAEA